MADSISQVARNGLGLGNVSNTSDANKPISTAQSAAFALISSFAVSKAVNGYQKMQGGLILQWGKGTTSSGSLYATYPIAFPSAVCSIQATISSSNPYTVQVYGAGSLVAFNAYTKDFTGSGINCDFYWLAIGY